MWTIRQQQMDALADDAFAQVLARVSRNVAAMFPEAPAALGHEGYAAWVRGLLEAGVALELTLEENLQRFVAWHAAVGVDAALTDVYPWAYDMLRAPDEHEDDRVAAVDLRMQGFDEEA